MPILVSLEVACLVLEGAHLDLNAMFLHSDHRASAQAQGLDNVLVPGVPGKLDQQKGSAPSHRWWKEGEGTMKDIPKPEPKFKKLKPSPKPKTNASPVLENAVHVNVQDKMKIDKNQVETISELEQQVPQAQPPVEDKNSLSDTSLMDVIANRQSKIDLVFVLQDRYAGNNLFWKILAKPKDFCNFEHQNGLIYLKLEDRELLCIPDYVHKGWSVKEIVINRTHSLLAHLGTRKTLAYL